MKFTIREEADGDFIAIGNLTIEAFSGCSLGHHGEAELIEQLRICGDPIISLVACTDERIVGHILFSPVELQMNEGSVPGMGLAPMSVVPKYQRTGIGKALVNAGLQRLADDDCPFVVVLGHPEYYGKFGFLPAVEFGISHGFAGIPQEVFLVKPLSKRHIQPMHCGKVFYQSVFGSQHSGS